MQTAQIKNVVLPLFASSVSAGFPSPAEDYIDKHLDLNELIVKHPASTFFIKVKGDSMIEAGISNGDLLTIDRSIEASNGSIILAVIHGEFTVKRLKKTKGDITLLPENPKYSPIKVQEGMNFEVWGVVTHVIKSLR